MTTQEAKHYLWHRTFTSHHEIFTRTYAAASDAHVLGTDSGIS